MLLTDNSVSFDALLSSVVIGCHRSCHRCCHRLSSVVIAPVIAPVIGCHRLSSLLSSVVIGCHRSCHRCCHRLSSVVIAPVIGCVIKNHHPVLVPVVQLLWRLDTTAARSIVVLERVSQRAKQYTPDKYCVD